MLRVFTKSLRVIKLQLVRVDTIGMFLVPLVKLPDAIAHAAKAEAVHLLQHAGVIALYSGASV